MVAVATLAWRGPAGLESDLAGESLREGDSGGTGEERRRGPRLRRAPRSLAGGPREPGWAAGSPQRSPSRGHVAIFQGDVLQGPGEKGKTGENDLLIFLPSADTGLLPQSLSEDPGRTLGDPGLHEPEELGFHLHRCTALIQTKVSARDAWGLGLGFQSLRSFNSHGLVRVRGAAGGRKAGGLRPAAPLEEKPLPGTGSPAHPGTTCWEGCAVSSPAPAGRVPTPAPQDPVLPGCGAGSARPPPPGRRRDGTAWSARCHAGGSEVTGLIRSWGGRRAWRGRAPV